MPTTSKKNKSVTALEKQQAAGQAFWNIARLYKLSREEQAILLDINPQNRVRLGELEKEEKIPEEADKLARVGTLIGIHKGLRILFPYNREIVYNWFKTKNPDFLDLSPMEYVATGTKEQNIFRLIAVRARVDQLRVEGF